MPAGLLLFLIMNGLFPGLSSHYPLLHLVVLDQFVGTQVLPKSV